MQVIMWMIDDVGNEVKEQSCIDDYDLALNRKIILKLRKISGRVQMTI